MRIYSNKKIVLKYILSLSVFLFLGIISGIAQPLVVDGGLSQTICNGTSVGIGGSPTANYGTPGYSYSWAPAAGLSSTTVSNPTASPSATTTYTITVTDAALTVATATLTVTVNPLPTVNGLLSPFVCNGATIAATNFGSTPAGGTFTWTNSNPAIGIPSSGVGNVPSFTATNSGSTVTGGNMAVTATLAGCSGPPTNYVITVKPTPIATSSPMAQTVCSGVNCNFALTSTVTGTSFSWATSGPGVTGNTASSGTVISQSVSTTGPTTGTANYIVTPVAAGCAGSAITPVLTVNPIPNVVATPSSLAICSGDVASLSFTGSVSGTTYSWTSSPTNVTGAAPTGSGPSLSETLTATTSSPGTVAYLVTPLASGCTGGAIFPVVTVNPPPNATFTYSSPACQNTPNIFPSFPTGGTAGTFSMISGSGLVINPSTGEIDLTTSTPGAFSITNFIAASGGCPSTNSNTGFTITAYQDPTITPIPFACANAAPFYFSAASIGGFWSGLGIINAANGQFDPTNSGPGTFTIIYQTGGTCFADTSIITVGYSDIYGKVTYSGGVVNSGTNTAVLFNYTFGFVSLDTIQISSINSSGYYQFAAVPTGNYLIKVFADTLIYPLAVPTYYDSEYLWDTALVKTHGCVTDTADVYLIEGIVTAGPGFLSGNVSEGAGFVRTPGDPIPGLDVKLGKNPGGAMVTSTQTNPFGNYTFSNIPINSPGEYYTIYVDIPGLQRDSIYNITVTATNFIFTQLDYLADSSSVFPVFPLATSSSNTAFDAYKFSVYPNPTTTTSTVEYELTNTSKVELGIYDVLGKKLDFTVNTSQNAGIYKVNLPKLKAGIYFINLSINNNSNTTRLVVID